MMTILENMKEIEQIEVAAPYGILTMYLNTDPKDNSQQRGEWRIRLKNGLNKIKEYIHNEKKEEELKHFEELKDKIMEAVKQEQGLKRGYALMASSDGNYFYTERLQFPVQNQFYWEETPCLEPLETLMEKYPKSGVITVQKDKVSVLEIELGEVLKEHHYYWDVNTNDWRNNEGPHRAEATLSHGNQRDEFNDRLEANRERWYKRLAEKLNKLAKTHDWKQIYLAGAIEEKKKFDYYLTIPITKKIEKNFSYHNNDKVINEIIRLKEEA